MPPTTLRLQWAATPRSLALVLALALLLVSFPRLTAPSTSRANPALQALAASNPHQLVTIIVQKTFAEAPVEAQVALLGGTVIYDLGFLKGFAAKLPAQAAAELARRPDVRWVALDAPVAGTSVSQPCAACIDTGSLVNTYVRSIGADRLWNQGPAYLQGQGITVAVIDSGMNSLLTDINTRLVQQMTFDQGYVYGVGWDLWGHGTHVAGLIGGNGARSNGKYIGVAPKVNLINLKVGNGWGSASTADVVAALQWVYDNRATYNIRVANISLTSTVAESYHASALNAAVELLWFSGVTVVVAGGNNGQADSGVGYAPSNDPFVISVGAVDEQGTPSPDDDRLAEFSSRGLTSDGFAKPELVAPGVNLVSLLAHRTAVLPVKYRASATIIADPSTGASFLRLSGTSMSSAVVAGAAALLLQDEPDLTPDQVKARLIADARPLSDGGWSGAYLDIYAAVNGTTRDYANQGLTMSQLLWAEGQPVAWDAANWSAANWSAANWSAANWSAANWSATSWSAVNLAP